MKRYVLLILGAALLTSDAITGQAKPQSIQGVWQAVEVTLPGPTKQTITIPEPRPNLTVITARHYSRVQVEAEGARPAVADAAKASSTSCAPRGDRSMPKRARTKSAAI
jgi:hypothetical protein